MADPQKANDAFKGKSSSNPFSRQRENLRKLNGLDNFHAWFQEIEQFARVRSLFTLIEYPIDCLVLYVFTYTMVTTDPALNSSQTLSGRSSLCSNEQNKR